jgi:hypothetical protein
MSNDLYLTVNPDHLIDCDPDRMVNGQPFTGFAGVFPTEAADEFGDEFGNRKPMSFRDLVCRAAAFGWGEGDDNDGNEWCADVLASYIPDMTPAEVIAIMYVVATAAADGVWGNAKEVTA